VPVLAFDQRALRRRDRLDDHRVRAEVEGARGSRHRVQRRARQQPVGTAGAVEGVGRHAALVEFDQAQRRRRVQRRRAAGGDTLIAQRAAQAPTPHAARPATAERHRLPQPRQPDRHVERRAADAGVQRHAGGGLAGREHVHQRFTTDHEHRHSSWRNERADERKHGRAPASRPPGFPLIIHLDLLICADHNELSRHRTALDSPRL
jgi:hypothetical protein